MIIKALVFISILFTQAMTLCAQGEQKIEVFTSVSYDRFIIYQALVLFWAGIIGLIVIIAMKLKELRRTREMDIDREEKDAPFLD